MHKLPLERIVSIVRNARKVVSRNYILPQLGSSGARDARQSSNGAQLRSAIQEIRRGRIGLGPKEFILSNNKGYWISEDPTEVRAFVVRQCARAKEHADTAEIMEQHLNAVLSPIIVPTEVLQPANAPRVRVKRDENTSGKST